MFIRLFRQGFGIAAICCGFLLSAHAAQAFGVSPVREAAVIDPGETEIVSITVTNEEGTAIAVVPTVDAFSVDPVTGAALFGHEDEAIEWIEPLDDEVLVLPGRAATLQFRVTVPEDAEPLSHFLGLFASQVPAEGQIGIGSRVGTLFFLHISGPVYEELFVESFTSNGQWHASGPVSLTLRLFNQGSIHLIPSGSLVLTNQNDDEIARFPINADQRKILPSGAWEQQFEISQQVLDKGIGQIGVTALVNYGLTEKRVVGTLSFWHVPPWAIVLIGSGVASILLVFILIRRRKRWYGR